MSAGHRILVLYGSYRADRQGIALAAWLVARLAERGAEVELVDAKAVGLPMLDRMFKEYPAGEAPPAMAALAAKIAGADAFVFVAGEYNWSVQPGLKNLTDHFLEQWYFRPAAIVSYSAGRIAGARANVAWHGILAEMGLAVMPGTLTVGGIASAFDGAGTPVGEGGAALLRGFPRFADELAWWTEAVRAQRERAGTPY